MSNISNKFKNLLSFKNDTRGKKAKKNIILIFFLHGFNLLSLILLVPLTIDYLGQIKYGIWVTLSSVVMWLGNLDFGIGNGLRNKLAEAFANNEISKAKTYTSTAYFIFGIGIVILILIFVILYSFINWTSIFNSPIQIESELNIAVFFVFIFFAIQFWIKLISSVINSDQKPALNSLLGVLANLLTLLFVFALYKTTKGNLLYIGLISSLIPIVVFGLASIILFGKMFRPIAPAFKSVEYKYSKDLIRLGGKFFIIQLSGLIIFATDNLIISQLLGPTEVTIYNVAYRYFYFIPLIFSVVLAPFWSAYTDAYAKNEITWITKYIRRILFVWALLTIIVVVMVFISDFIYELWVGKEIQVPFLLSVLMGFFVVIFNWNNIFSYFLNGIGKVQIQLYISIFIAVVNIPLSIFFVKYLNMGISGVMMATCICLSIGTIWSPIQYFKIINKTAHGIWNK